MATARRIARRSPLAGVDDQHGAIDSSSAGVRPSAGIGSSGDESNAIESPIVIGGIAAASAVLVALTVWLAWVLCRSKQTKRRSSRDDEARPPLPKDWDSVAEHFNRAKSPQPQSKSNVLAQQFAFPHLASGAARTEQPPASSFLNTRAKSPQHPIKPNEVGKPQALPHLFSRPLSRDEFRILDHHTQTNTLPQPFTKVQPQDVARIELAVRNRNSTALPPLLRQQQLPSSASPVRNASPSQFSPAPRRIHSIISSKHHSAATVASSASSFSFASMPYRSGIHSLDAVQEDGSVSNRSSSSDAGPALSIPRIQPGFHVAKVAFTPLLPDEVELKVGERATVVDVYSDGWCVVLLGVVMGAVPLYCFVEPSTEEPEGFERTRPPRKASLGVTVELETGTDASDADADSDTPLEPPEIASSVRHPSSRHDSVFSWSNF